MSFSPGCICRWTDRETLRNARHQTTPEGDERMRLAGMQREHGVVMGARFLHARELRKKEAELHEVSPCVGFDALVESQQTRRPRMSGRGGEGLLAFLSG